MLLAILRSHCPNMILPQRWIQILMHCRVLCRPQLTEGSLPEGLPIHLFVGARTKLTYNKIERFFHDSLLIHLLFHCDAVLITTFDLICTWASREKNTVVPLLWGMKSQQIAAAFWGNQNTPRKMTLEWLADAAHWRAKKVLIII